MDPANPSSHTGPEPRLVERRNGLWIFYKPSGYHTHPPGKDEEGPMRENRDMVSWARTRFPGEGAFSPVHRLDLETSGLLLMSPDPETCREAGEWFASGSVKKSYLALVHGRTRRHGTVKRTLKTGRHGKGQEAVTRYRVKEWIGPFSLLTVHPEQGRRHQIRRHMKGIGHPVVGDRRYARHLLARIPHAPGRLWLHAWRLELPDGTVFEEPLPPELSLHLETLRAALEPGS